MGARTPQSLVRFQAGAPFFSALILVDQSGPSQTDQLTVYVCRVSAFCEAELRWWTGVVFTCHLSQRQTLADDCTRGYIESLTIGKFAVVESE